MRLETTFSELARLLDVNSSCELTVNSILIDSRKPIRSHDTLFVAIKGPYNDGHTYIPQLIEEGISMFVVNEDWGQEQESVNFIRVPDTLKALQKIASWHRQRFDFPVIGVTGSAGKTWVKEWLYELLKNDYNIVRNPKSYNSQIGVPLSILQMTPDHNLAIFEAGISQPGEMVNLQQVIAPDFGILTNIGSAHAHNFQSPEQQRREKIILFEESKWWIDGDSLPMALPEGFSLSDKASRANASICYHFLSQFTPHKLDEYEPKFAKLEPLALRLEVQKGLNGNVIINDSYNSDLAGLEIALDLAAKQRKDGIVLVLSDVDSDRASKKEVYQNIARIIKGYDVEQTFCIGTEIEILPALLDNCTHYPSVDLLDTTKLKSLRNRCVLVKGARKFRFERIARSLQEKQHTTVLEINLNAVLHNLNYFRSQVDDAKLMCMVKAFGYGAGDVEVARLLQNNGVYAFGVAYADEGVRLRQAGINVPIMVMNTEPAAFPSVIENQLEPVIYSLEMLDLFVRELINYEQTHFPIHLELETGMNRLGFRLEDIAALTALINSQPEVKVESVFSHLAASEDDNQDGFTRLQLERFTQGVSQIREAVGYEFNRHIANSAAILRFPEMHLDMVRLGVALYGVDPLNQEVSPLRVVGSLKTRITQIRDLAAGETIGYGRSGTISSGGKVAVIPIGYADGLRRSLSNGVGSVYVNGAYAPIVGKVCMDMTMVDVSNLDCAEGDEVEVFGDNISITDLARKMDTIPYEVLTSVSSRVKRTYIEE